MVRPMKTPNSHTPGPWQPILEGEDAAAALAVVRDIADELTRIDLPAHVGRRAPTLSSGQSGIALLHAYLDACFPEEDHRERTLVALDDALDGIDSVLRSPALCDGFVGVAWTLAHLEIGLWQSGEVDDLQPLDEALVELLEAGWDGPYDLISGLVGFALYALERPDSALLARGLWRVLGLLDETSERWPDGSPGITWKTLPRLLPEHQRQVAPDGYYNLGLAHGVPGIIAMLSQVCGSPEPPALARTMLRGAMDWLAEQGLLPDQSDNMDAWLVPGADRFPGRTAWCYGDPGVAIALAQGALALDDRAMYRHAMTMGRRAAARDVAAALVRDGGICHGAAGLGHIFNRMYQATGEAEFLDAARRWFMHLLGMREPGRGIAGYLFLLPTDTRERGTEWQPGAGLLTGATGVALALLAAATPVEPLWDRHLLCALPPRSR